MKNTIILLIFAIVLLPSVIYSQNTAGNAIYLGNKNTSFMYSDTKNTANYTNNYRGESTKDVFYKFSISKSMTITISHCGSELDDTYIYLLDANQRCLRSTNDCLYPGLCTTQPYAPSLEYVDLPIGTYFVVVEGFEEDGYITTTIEGMLPPTNGNTLSSPIYIGSKTDAFTYSDTQNTNIYSNNFGGRPTKDVFYKFTLTTSMDIVISHCGSSLSDTYVSLLNSSGNVIASNDNHMGEGACQDTHNAYLYISDLSVGTYYVVSEGSKSNGIIVTSIEGILPYSDPTLSCSQNYILTITPTISSSYSDGLSANQCLRTVQYYDDLGRLVQTVQINANPEKHDLVTYQEYDIYGRKSNAWLPTVATRNNGEYVPYITFTNKASSTYEGDSKPYSKSIYESSPLNRVLEEYGPGQAWHNISRSVKTDYLSNIVGVDTLNCVRYGISYSSSSDTILTINRSGSYASNELFVTRIFDEDDNGIYKFTNKLGQVILTRQFVRDINGKELYDTYYIYDDFGNLAVVLPPILSGMMQNGNEWLNTTSIINQYAYLYVYDHRNRCKAKKTPGCNWIFYMYDKADRLIFTQDGNQRNKSPREWTFTIPDKHNRNVLTGICTSIPDIQTLNQAFVCASYPQNGTGFYMGYDINGISPSGYTILQANYYDHYKFRNLPGFSNSGLAYESSGIDSKYLTRHGTDSSAYEHQGLCTGVATAQLNPSATLTYLYSVMYYDNLGRVIQTKSTNHLPGGLEKEYMAYNFNDQLTYYLHVHSGTGKTNQTEQYSYTYDTWGRPLVTKHRINSGTEVTLADNIYDELGRLSSNKRNDHPYLHMNYSYNIRSWVKSISNQHFWENLSYTFGGNINNQQWGQAAKVRNYSFAYDELSRLKRATYSGDGEYGTNYNYDKHGNIRNLIRYGNTGINTSGIIDHLFMDYNGNQLVKVEDTAPVPTLSSSADFRNGMNAAVEYFYDANGNMTKDLNNGISNIEYNVLNLPRSLSISNASGSATNTYVYAADGRKLSTAKNGFITDYAGNVIYENGVFKRILVEGGYYENGMYYFYIQDHLGNNRIVANQNGAVVQSTQYYPYGMVFADGENQNLQPYKYNGKELDTDRRLNLYDYSARYMDAALGRFTTIDPLAEKYYAWSPYSYVMNNPMRYIDPDGRETQIPPTILPLPFMPPPPYVPYKPETPPSDAQIATDANKLVTETVDKLKFHLTITALVFGIPIINAILENPNESVLDTEITVLEATDSSKNEKHGDAGRSIGKSEKRIGELEAKKEGANKKEKERIDNKIRRIKQNAQKNKKGTEDTKTGKRK